MKVNLLRDIIVYYVRVNQDKEVNMQHPKDVKGSDKSLLSIPVGQRYTTILGRLDTIEANVTNTKHNFVGHTRSILDRLGIIEERIAIMQEKIDGIN